MKKIFTCLIALVLGMSMSWAQTILLTEEQETMLHAQRAPQAVQAETVATTTLGVAYADYRKVNGYNLFQLQIYIDYPEQLCFCVAGKPAPPYTTMNATTFDTNNSSIYTYNALPTGAGQSINGTKVKGSNVTNTGVSVSGSIQRVYENKYGDFYYIDVYVTGTGTANSRYNKCYHLTGYIRDQKGNDAGGKEIGDAKYSFSDDYTQLRSTLSMENASTAKVNSQARLTVTAGDFRSILNFVSNTNYVPTGKYSITNSGAANTVVPFPDNGDKTKNSHLDFSNYQAMWYICCGDVIVINPNHSSTPLFVQTKFGTSTMHSSAYYDNNYWLYGSVPSKSQITTSATNGTIAISCAEGQGYTTDNTSDFTRSNTGNYYYQGTKLTLTAEPATGYRFVRWKDGNTQLSTDATYEYTVGSSNATITAEFELQKFTVTIAKDPSDYGTVSQTSVANVPYGTVITTNNNKVTINGTTVTATATTGDAQYTYAFTGWTNGTTTVTAATTVTANFSRTLNQYTVTINDPEHGTLTVKNNETSITSGTKVDYGTTLTVTYQADEGYHFGAWTNDGAAGVTIDGDKTIGATFAPNVHTLTWAGIDGATLSGDYTAAGDVAYGTTLVAPEVEKAGFNFLGWSPAFVESTTMPDNDVTYTAQWEEAATFTLEDQHNAGEAYYTSLAGFVGSTKDVTYQRTLGGGTADAPCWSTFSLPFNYPLYGNDRTFQDKVVYLDHASYDAGSGILTLNFMYETYKIEANKPYALYNTGSAIVNPVFENVEIVGQTDGSYTVGCTTGGSVTFTNTQTRQKLNANDPNTIYVAGQALRYPGAATYMRAFSGYFVLDGVYSSANIAPRVRVVINEEDATAIMSEETPAQVETKKYMENGILVIERAGIRYTAQGACLR